jgi:hypothetical protein
MQKKLIEKVSDLVDKATPLEKMNLIEHLKSEISGDVEATMPNKTENEIKREILTIVQAGVTLNMSKPIDIMARLA